MTDCESQYRAALKYITGGGGGGATKVSKSDQLIFYALHKQITTGACTQRAPSRFKVVAFLKHQVGSITLAFVKHFSRLRLNSHASFIWFLTLPGLEQAWQDGQNGGYGCVRAGVQTRAAPREALNIRNEQTSSVT
jgi:hypothetical protein